MLPSNTTLPTLATTPPIIAGSIRSVSVTCAPAALASACVERGASAVGQRHRRHHFGRDDPLRLHQSFGERSCDVRHQRQPIAIGQERQHALALQD